MNADTPPYKAYLSSVNKNTELESPVHL